VTVTKTVPLLMLLNELNRLRDESGVSAERAAQELGCRVSKISRIHLGQSKISPGDTKLLAELHGAPPELVEVLVDLARNLGQKGDWTSYGNVYRDSFRFLLDLEAHSSRVQVMEAEIVPGLLQTDGYVQALSQAPTLSGEPRDIDAVVDASRARRTIVTRVDDPPMLSFILSESVLRRRYGDAAVMREQLTHLVEVAQRPNVQIQVLPFHTESPVSYVSLHFALLHVPGPGIAAPLDIAYIELFDDARYLDGHDSVAAYTRLWGFMQAAALGPSESLTFIQKIINE
jgi:hypothetical protein